MRLLDALALRPLMDALSQAYAAATVEFDEVFAAARKSARGGERPRLGTVFPPIAAVRSPE